jgi:tRNA(Arg) A34 adenosine deaminase TadA
MALALDEARAAAARGEVPVGAVISAADGSTLYSWTTEPPRANLKPGEALHFRTRLATPPEAGRHVEVRFADQAVVARART